MMQRLRNSRQGFTLIEVVIAIAIFMFGITALLGLFQVGGSLEQSARVHAELAPSVEPLVESVRQNAWIVDAKGKVTGLREIKGEAVPGAAGYRYDLIVRKAGDNPALRRAELRFYRKSPDRVLSRVTFLLEEEVPIAHFLEGQKK